MPDAAEADYAQGLAPDVGAGELLRPPGFPLAGPQKAFGLAETAGGGQEQHEGGVGGRFFEDAGRIGNEDAAFGCGFDVYIVVADGHVGDDLEGFARPRP